MEKAYLNYYWQSKVHTKMKYIHLFLKVTKGRKTLPAAVT